MTHRIIEIRTGAYYSIGGGLYGHTGFIGCMRRIVIDGQYKPPTSWQMGEEIMDEEGEMMIVADEEVEVTAETEGLEMSTKNRGQTTTLCLWAVVAVAEDAGKEDLPSDNDTTKVRDTAMDMVMTRDTGTTMAMVMVDTTDMEAEEDTFEAAAAAERAPPAEPHAEPHARDPARETRFAETASPRTGTRVVAETGSTRVKDAIETNSAEANGIADDGKETDGKETPPRMGGEC